MRIKDLLKQIVSGGLILGFLLSMLWIPGTVYAQETEGTESSAEMGEMATEETTEVTSEESDTEEDTEIVEEGQEATTEESTESIEEGQGATTEESTESIEEGQESAVGETVEINSGDEEQADGGFVDAEWIPVNQSIYGSGSQCYKFKIDNDGYFMIDFEHAMEEGNLNRFYEIYLYDSNFKTIETWHTLGDEPKVSTCRLGGAERDLLYKGILLP